MTPYVRGSDTSREAAESHDRKGLGRLERQVLAFVAVAGARGATDDEIEAATGLTHQTASARRNALVRKGYACDSGTRRATRTGRKAVVWVAGQGTPLNGAPNDRVTRPTNTEIRIAEAEVAMLVRASVNYAEPDALVRLRTWLRHISRG